MPYNTHSNLIGSIGSIVKRLERVERNSGRAYFVTKQTTNYVASRYDVVLADATGGSIIVTLPEPLLGIVVIVKRLNSGANSVIIIPNGTEKIDNGTSLTITTQYNSYTMTSDGTDWWVI